MFHVKQSQRVKIDSYIELVKKYHKTLDLISPKGLEQIETKIEDTLQYISVIQKETIEQKALLDVGSGIGLPGIIEAVLLTDFSVDLVERRQKRATFLKIVVANLELGNTQVIAEDVRLYKEKRYSVISALAVGSFLQLYLLTCHLHTKTVMLLSRKGEFWADEIVELEKHLKQSIVAENMADLSTHGSLIKVIVPGGIICPQ